MDKLKMHTPDKTDENIEKIAALFPNAMTEVIKGYREDGTAIIERAIDFDVLRQELSDVVVDGLQERYQFTWPDKRKSILLANQPIAKTMRPCREESVDFDTTENLYIEGDNLNALKLLQETYLGKVKMIYIDPPYNTGNDFVYDDDFSQSTEEYMVGSGQFDEVGGRLVPNLESNGRFHTDWLNMIYPRLKLAKDLLTDDGVIYISIDDNEMANMQKMCDEVFGKSCFIGNICRATGTTTAQGTNSLGKSFDYMLMYSKSKGFIVGGLDLDENDKARYNMEDEKGKFSILQLRRTGGEDRREDRPSMYYGIETPDGTIVYPKGPTGYDSRWRVGQETYKKMLGNGEIHFKKDNGNWGVYYKFYLEGRTKRPSNLWNDIEGNKKAQIDLKALIPEKVFDTPKPLELIRRALSIANVDNESIVLDFFSGSATTAHAVMLKNAEDGGKRKFIMVQWPEKTDEKTEAYKAGYENICEIGKERIRRAGKRILEEMLSGAGRVDGTGYGIGIDKYEEYLKLTGEKVLDIGFRVLKIDSTNMRKVRDNPAEIKQDQIGMFADNIKPDRTSEDLLFQVMLDLGILLSSKIEGKEIGGKHVFSVADGYLIACFDNNVTSDTVTEIAKMKPYYAVFRDSSMASDSVATNFEQIFATYSPTTVRKVL